MKTETKVSHTPGPWQLESITNEMRESGDYDASDFFIIKSLPYMNLATIHGWSPAGNAKLIAAAPELLAALIHIKNVLGKLCMAQDTPECDAYYTAEEVIKKATV